MLSQNGISCTGMATDVFISPYLHECIYEKNVKKSNVNIKMYINNGSAFWPTSACIYTIWQEVTSYVYAFSSSYQTLTSSVNFMSTFDSTVTFRSVSDLKFITTSLVKFNPLLFRYIFTDWTSEVLFSINIYGTIGNIMIAVRSRIHIHSDIYLSRRLFC